MKNPKINNNIKNLHISMKAQVSLKQKRDKWDRDLCEITKYETDLMCSIGSVTQSFVFWALNKIKKIYSPCRLKMMKYP